MVLIAPLALGWYMQHFAKRVCAWIVSIPDLSFYLWAVQLSVTSGVTVRNIVHSEAGLPVLLMIAAMSLILCFVLFLVGRSIGRHLGDEIDGGQALFQKNTALSIWVAYTYLNPVAQLPGTLGVSQETTNAPNLSLEHLLICDTAYFLIL